MLQGNKGMIGPRIILHEFTYFGVCHLKCLITLNGLNMQINANYLESAQELSHPLVSSYLKSFYKVLNWEIMVQKDVGQNL